MEIQEIKRRLKIETVLTRYNLTPDRNNRMRCPFHDDKTPSMQIYPETGTWTCFSSNCSAGSGDQIDFIMKYEKITKHQAIIKAKEMLGEVTTFKSSAAQLSRTAVLTKIYHSFRNGMHRGQAGRQYATERGLDPDVQDIGFNSGQYHHNNKLSEQLLSSFIKYGLLKPIGNGLHHVFGKNCICFALRDKENHVTGLYFRSVLDSNGNSDTTGKPSTVGRHYYLKDRQGLYPGYPKPGTRKLILTEAIIDAATLARLEDQVRDYEILSLYGTNGFTREHKAAIEELKELREIILFFDGDEAGEQAIRKHSETLHELKPGVKITGINTPAGHDINSLYLAHDKEIFTHLMETRQTLFSSTENTSSEIKKDQEQIEPAEKARPAASTELDTSNPYNLRYTGHMARYSIKGGLRNDMDSMKVSIVIESLKGSGPYQKYRNKTDLYENRQTEKLSREAGEKLDERADLIEKDLHRLTDLLENYRDSLQAGGKGQRQQVKTDPGMIKRCRSLLESPGLTARLNRLIGRSGVTGEETNRLFLFIIASSYKMPDTLHALIQGSTGSGKTHLLEKISRLMPGEDVKRFTRVTDSSFYNYGAYDLQNKLICLEDLDGMKEEAQLAFRELQSREMLSTSTTGQDERGNLRSYEKVVYGPIASLACTTRGEIYEDNMSRCFIIAVDETMEQTERVVRYQNKKAAGQVDAREEKETATLLQHCIRLLKPCPVINPYADKVHLPQQAHKIRRLNELYQSFVKQVTILHQYKREKDKRGRLITRKEDMQIAADIMFESILLKIDELDGSLRQFYERLKDYVKATAGEHSDTYTFSQRELRQALNVSKSQLQRYIYDLTSLEYISISGGHINRGYRYKIIYWDDITRIRGMLRRHLEGQLSQLELIPVEN